MKRSNIMIITGLVIFLVSIAFTIRWHLGKEFLIVFLLLLSDFISKLSIKQAEREEHEVLKKACNDWITEELKKERECNE